MNAPACLANPWPISFADSKSHSHNQFMQSFSTFSAYNTTTSSTSTASPNNDLSPLNGTISTNAFLDTMRRKYSINSSVGNVIDTFDLDDDETDLPSSYSSPSNGNDNNNQDKIQLWSKLLLAETTHPYQMRGLLKDIALRLNRQHDILEHLQQYIQTNILPEFQPTNSQQLPPPQKENSTSINHPNGVIPAFMSHDWWDKKATTTQRSSSSSSLAEQTLHWQEIQQALEMTQKNIHNLLVLHRDTSRQCQQLYKQLPPVDVMTSNDDNNNNNNNNKIQDQLASYQLSTLQKRQLAQVCKEVYARHALTIESMAEVVIDLRGILLSSSTNGKNTWNPNAAHQQQQQQELLQRRKEHFTIVQTMVTAFLKSRLMTQLLCDHVVDCNTTAIKNTSNGTETTTKVHGAISVDANVPVLVQQAVTEACHLVEAHFLDQPTVLIHVENGNGGDGGGDHDASSSSTSNEITCTLVRPWLQYALVELLKNSLAITVERNRRVRQQRQRQEEMEIPSNQKDATNNTKEKDDDNGVDSDNDDEAPLCPIHIRIFDTDSKVVIQIMDQAGGLLWNNPEIKEKSQSQHEQQSQSQHEHEERPHMFEFANCTHKWDRLQDQRTYAIVRSPVRGLGVGLALSRMHLERFGGTLEIENRPEYDPISNLESGITVTLTMGKNYYATETDPWVEGNGGEKISGGETERRKREAISTLY